MTNVMTIALMCYEKQLLLKKSDLLVGYCGFPNNMRANNKNEISFSEHKFSSFSENE